MLGTGPHNVFSRYTHWLHGCWPAGTVEKLPRCGPDGRTSVPGVFVVGDLTGVPLLKFSADTGARAVRTIAADPRLESLRAEGGGEVLDLVIIGAGVSGFAAALEAKKAGLSFVLLESSEPFSTVVNFPKRKPIYAYPTEMTPAGDMRFEADVKEGLLDELREQTLSKGVEPLHARAECVRRRAKLIEVALADADDLVARRVIVAIGRSGNFRKLDVPGEELDKVSNRLHDPKDFAGKHVLVVGGGDSALESAIAIAEAGGRVALSYRKPELSRPKPDNVERLERVVADGRVDLRLGTEVTRIDSKEVELDDGSRLPNDSVFTMIGREPPLDFFRRSGISIRGETRGFEWLPILVFFVLVWLLYDWKNHGPIFRTAESFPGSVRELLAGDPSTLVGTLGISMGGRSFYYTLLYSLAIVGFGVLRIRRRKTPYVTLQTLTLMAIQVLSLFLLPELILPWLGYNGWFDGGAGAWFADSFFEQYEGWIPGADYHPRAYWRAYGFVLAWPLMVYNIFTTAPIWPWIVLGTVQTFVLIPLIVLKWGKGAYCGWICSCGGLAETAGDSLRERMPHGVVSNRLNMIGQAILGAAFLLLALRIIGWIMPGSVVDRVFPAMLEGSGGWKWTVDVFLGGILGVGLYVKYSGRVWCRFACPLAALMHVYARFSRFRILADKKKCISCNVCTSVCHMGIDVMSFANKGEPMADPQCVRCSACVQSCPTGVLEFGEIDRTSGEVVGRDRLAASPVLMRESGAPD